MQRQPRESLIPSISSGRSLVGEMRGGYLGKLALRPVRCDGMVEVRGLTKKYEEPDGGEILAADNVSFTCRAGEIFGLLGPNGAGKTTTMRCLATVLTPSAGTANVAGHDLLGDPENVRRQIGFLSG